MDNQLSLIGCVDAQYSTVHKTEQIIDHFPIIYREEGSVTRLAMENYFKNYGGINSKKMELTSNGAVKQAVIAGIGCSLMPFIGLKHELQANELRIIPRQDLPINTKWNLIWLKQKKLSFAGIAYIAFLKANKEKITERHFSWCEKYAE
jgi:DNA-binding transcriptional LysR family regulator